MSYARWSSDSEVYVYEHVEGGWTTDTGGEKFNDPTPGACADRLESLQAQGRKVPQDAIDELRREEMGEEVVG